METIHIIQVFIHNNNNTMIARLTGNLGKDMFTIASASIWAWKQDKEMVFVGDTLYNDTLYRGLAFSEALPDHEELPAITPSLEDYEEYRDRIKGLFSIFSTDIEKIVDYAQSLPDGPVTVISCTDQVRTDYYIEAMDTMGSDLFVAIGDPEVGSDQQVYYSPFREDMLNLILMIGADNLIIDDSPISWWGAYLNCRDSRVVCPRSIAPAMCLDNWTRI